MPRSRRLASRPRQLAALLFALAIIPFAVLASQARGGAQRSRAVIPAGETYLLGGEQRTAISLVARNVGAIPVRVAGVARGRSRAIASLRPGDSVVMEFGVREVAAFRNEATRGGAVLAIKVTPDAGPISMRYGQR